MKVLHVTHQFAPETTGGVERYVADLCRGQRAAGHEVEILTGSIEPWPDVGVERFEVDGVPVHRLHRNDLYFDHHVKAWHPGVEQAFRTLLAQMRPDVVHVHQWIRLTSTLIAEATAAGCATAVTLHDFYTSCPRAFRRRPDTDACLRPVCADSCATCVPKYGHESGDELREGVEIFADSYRDELERAGVVFVAVHGVADLLTNLVGMPRSRFEVLPLGYRPRFRGLERLSLDPAPGEPYRFAFWGGVGRHKGVDVLLDAFRRLRDQRDDVELHVLGGFESEAFETELRQRADGLGVTFHGPFEQEALYQLRPHAGVFPSTCLETFGLVLDECFELGLPAIVSDLGALPSRVGEGGIVVPAGDVGALAAAMSRLRDDGAVRVQLRDGHPGRPPLLEDHVANVVQHYETARTHPAPTVEPRVSVDRRIAFLQMQRDTALGRAAPPHGPS